MKVTPVKGTNDYLPKEVEIRDYLQQKILSFMYRSNYSVGSIPQGAFACFCQNPETYKSKCLTEGD